MARRALRSRSSLARRRRRPEHARRERPPERLGAAPLELGVVDPLRFRLSCLLGPHRRGGCGGARHTPAGCPGWLATGRASIGMRHSPEPLIADRLQVARLEDESALLLRLAHGVGDRRLAPPASRRGAPLPPRSLHVRRWRPPASRTKTIAAKIRSSVISVGLRMRSMSAVVPSGKVIPVTRSIPCHPCVSAGAAALLEAAEEVAAVGLPRPCRHGPPVVLAGCRSGPLNPRRDAEAGGERVQLGGARVADEVRPERPCAGQVGGSIQIVTPSPYAARHRPSRHPCPPRFIHGNTHRIRADPLRVAMNQNAEGVCAAHPTPSPTVSSQLDRNGGRSPTTWPGGDWAECG